MLIDRWRQHIHRVFLVTTDTGTSLDREYRDKLITEPGIAMNPSFLEELNESYERVLSRYGDIFMNLSKVDTSRDKNTTPQSTALEVATKILESLEE